MHINWIPGHYKVYVHPTSTKQTTRGSAQGISTSGLYFCLFIKDLPFVLKYAKQTLFADHATVVNAAMSSKLHTMIEETESMIYLP